MSTVETRDPRERLLDAADELFCCQGYRATGVNEIISRASVCKASFYNHFKSKEDLLVAQLERLHDRALGALRDFVSRGATPAARVLRLLEALENERRKGTQGCPYLNISAEFPDESSTVRQVVRWHHEALRSYVRELAAAHFREQGLGEAEVGRRADELYVLIQGVTAVLHLHAEPWPLEAARRVVCERLGLPDSRGADNPAKRGNRTS